MARLTVRRIASAAAALLIGIAFSATPATAQTGATVRVARTTPVLEGPRGDSIPVSSVRAGQVLELLDRRGNWLLVSPPDDAAPKATWVRGWIHAGAVEAGSLPALAREDAPPPRGPFMIRGFGQAGGSLFAARDSFDSILGNGFGLLFGGGGQVVLPNGAFVQVSVERFEETGSRVLVSGNQLFTLDTPTRISVRPILFSVGYRSFASRRYAPYLGAGIGLHELTEDSPTLPAADTISERKVGYHILGGAEFALGRWVALAGEVQWAGVPNALGETGLSALLEEDDLGGTTFRIKLVFGY